MKRTVPLGSRLARAEASHTYARRFQHTELYISGLRAWLQRGVQYAHTVQRGRERERESGAVIALEASKCRGGAGEGGHERKGVGFSARYSGQGLRWTNWGSCYARLARGEANLAHLHYRNESLPNAVAREGDKQLKIYNTCSHSGSARHGWTRSNLCTSLSFLFLSRYIYMYMNFENTLVLGMVK